MPLSRRNFIRYVSLVAGAFALPGIKGNDNRIMTVNGWMEAGKAGFTLSHEHVLVDFIGADKADPSRYDADEVFHTALPYLKSAKDKGCTTLMECTPAYLGRDVRLLQRLSKASGLNILTNTGYYGAAGEKYLPSHAYTETAEQIASRWINEWKNGIDNSDIKPGFIKSGVDKFPLSGVQHKMAEAAAITHLATGLTIGIHTGDGKAAMEELRIVQSKGVSAGAWIWIHAQNEKNRHMHISAAKAGGWISFDGVNDKSVSDCLVFLKDMKKENLLGHILLSHDAGWYHVGEPKGGNYQGYTVITDKLIPAMQENDFTEKDIAQIFITNPANAFAIKIRKS